MSVMLKNLRFTDTIRLLSRNFSYTSALEIKQWRIDRGLPVNRNAEGVLTDGPDYTFLDGRPTPLLHKQKFRMEKQQGYAACIVELSSELDFAKERHKNMLDAEEKERQRILSSRLKAKGQKLKKLN